MVLIFDRFQAVSYTHLIERQNVHYVEAHQCEDEIKQFLELFNITYSSDMLVS